ncbi:MAG: hypothetical protein V2I50_04220 [Desulfuromusa sp.]|jgi:hypothetical protein|nr:hypothetical protein [Desulfuromusa sp.]
MNQHLQQFAKQLAIWSEAIIEHGRTPFRRVDTYPDIDTDQGVKSPPLVFWINRQSMMAGGVLLLPEGDLETELKTGCSCATALGLRHFVTWEVNQVRIWQIEEAKTVEKHSFPLSKAEQPETFRHLLTEILDALKLLAILGAIPTDELSPHYFNNLFQITLEQALPPLTEAYRSQRSETDKHSPEDTDTCANEANRLLLLQVLSLLWFNKCPDAILPEKMEQAIELSMVELPGSLQQALSFKTVIKPPPLPLETAVFFHHLLLRLHQLAWKQENERAKGSIHRLAEYWFQSPTAEEEPASTYLYPEGPMLSPDIKILLSGSLSLLATSALLAEISNLSPKTLIFGNLFELDRDSLPKELISGRLLNQNRITHIERPKYSTNLRSAWPNRRLKIKGGQPLWHWELIHLLGLCHGKQSLSLEVPAELINSPENQLAWSLLYENYGFQKIQLLKNGNIKLKISRDMVTNETVPVQIEEETREITPIEEPICFKNQILLTINLPKEVYKLLGSELIWPTPDAIPGAQLHGWEFYTRSRLYKLMQILLPSESSEDEMSENPLDSCVPYPEPLLLNELAGFERTNSTKNRSMTIDHFLADLLSCPTVASIELPRRIKARKTLTSDSYSERNLKETIEQQLSTHGIPNFPEQYLYFLDQPVMRHYTIAPPLTVKNNLLGEFELEDAQGRIISGYGEELKQTLLICSESGKTEIDLPNNRQQLEKLLQHYLKDLDVLHNYLSHLCYSQIKDSKSAQKVIKNTWGKLNLPKIAWFKH